MWHRSALLLTRGLCWGRNDCRAARWPKDLRHIQRDSHYDRGDRTSSICIKVDLTMDVSRENIRPRHLYSLGKVGYGDFETDAHYLVATVSKQSVTYSASNVLKVF